MTNNATIETAKGLTFGTELEYTNISREKAARAIHSVTGGSVRYYGGGYDAWQVTAPDGRVWKAVSDGSLTDRATSAEVVTPILRWEDLDTLQAVVRALRKAGAKTPSCTSQHVHVGVSAFTARQIANIARIWMPGHCIRIAVWPIFTMKQRCRQNSAKLTKPTIKR